MSNYSHIFHPACVFNIFNKARYIVLGDIIGQGILPINRIFIWIKSSMPFTVFIASCISHPHIIACISENKSNRVVPTVY